MSNFDLKIDKNKSKLFKKTTFALAIMVFQTGAAFAHITYEDFWNREQHQWIDQIKKHVTPHFDKMPRSETMDYGGDRGEKNADSGCRLKLCMLNPKGPMDEKKCRHDVRALNYQLSAPPEFITSPIRHQKSVPMCMTVGKEKKDDKPHVVDTSKTVDSEGNSTRIDFENEIVSVYRYNETSKHDELIFQSSRTDSYSPDKDGITRDRPKQSWINEDRRARKISYKCIYTAYYLKNKLQLTPSLHPKDEYIEYDGNSQEPLYIRHSAKGINTGEYQNFYDNDSANLYRIRAYGLRGTHDIFTAVEWNNCASQELITPKPSKSQLINPADKNDEDENSLLITDLKAAKNIDAYAAKNLSAEDPDVYDLAVIAYAPQPKDGKNKSSSIIKSDDPERAFFEKGDRVEVRVLPQNHGDVNEYGRPAISFDTPVQYPDELKNNPMFNRKLTPAEQEQLRAELKRHNGGEDTIEFDEEGRLKSINSKVGYQPPPKKDQEEKDNDKNENSTTGIANLDDLMPSKANGYEEDFKGSLADKKLSPEQLKELQNDIDNAHDLSNIKLNPDGTKISPEQLQKLQDSLKENGVNNIKLSLNPDGTLKGVTYGNAKNSANTGASKASKDNQAAQQTISDNEPALKSGKSIDANSQQQPLQQDRQLMPKTSDSASSSNSGGVNEVNVMDEQGQANN